MRHVRNIAAILLLPACVIGQEAQYEPARSDTFPLPPPKPYTPTIADPVTEPWRWTRFPELAGTGVECLTEGDDGAMWFGVDDGVYRYDGLEWTHFGTDDGIYGDKVWALEAGSEGTLYAGTDMGISRYDGDRWQRIFPPEGDVPWGVGVLEWVDGDLWAGTSLGLLRLSTDGGSRLYTASEPDPAFRQLAPYVDIALLPAGARPSLPWHWNSEASFGLSITRSRMDRGRVPVYVVDLAPDGPAAHAGVRVGDRLVGEYPDWFDPPDQMTLRVIPVGSSDTLTVDIAATTVDGHPALVPVGDRAILPVDDGLWVGGGSGHVFFFDPDAPADDPSARVYDLEAYGPILARTQDGVLWVATGHSGRPLFRISGDRVTEMSAQDMGWPGNDTHSSALVTKDGTLYVGMHGGNLRAWRDDAWHYYSEVPTSWARVTGLHEARDGALWLVVRGSEALRLDRSSRFTTYEDLWRIGGTSTTDIFVRIVPDREPSTAISPDIVRRRGDTWTRQALVDGLLSWSTRAIVARDGRLWVAGSLDSVAAAVALDDSTAIRTLHPGFSHEMGFVATGFQASNGDLWFAPSPNTRGSHTGAGSLVFDGEQWRHLHGEGAPDIPYGFAELPDGSIVTTGDQLRRFDGQRWHAVEAPAELSVPYSHGTIVDRHGTLWVSTRAYGVFRRVNDTWSRFTPRSGLPGQQVGVVPGPDGEAWGRVNQKGGDEIIRFDGDAWVPALPASMSAAKTLRFDYGRGDGSLWLHPSDGDDGRSARDAINLRFDDRPPETTITLAADEISQPGNAVVSWRGADPWRDTSPEELRYSWRLDGGDWSPFTTATTHTLLELPDGDHTLEVRSRDRDLNVDPTPAVARFAVVPPVWKQAWFLGLMAVMLAAVAVQTTRVLRRDQRLTEHNRDLLLDRAAERVRAEAMAMRSADDIRRVVGVVRRELIDVGFDERRPTIVNYVSREDTDRLYCYFAVPNPKRFGYTWTSPNLWELDEQTAAALFEYDDLGRRVRESIAEGRIDRLEMPGQPARTADRMASEYGVDPAYMQHVHHGERLTEVPFDQGQIGIWGTDYLSDDEVAILRALCDALSLGFTRYEDFRQLEQASTNKSQFLRRMSHDLRSPMNAIIGYTRLLQRRLADRLDEREARNLGNIETSSNNLLNLINDILDLSRIEAGRVEIQARDFDPCQLASECADALESIVKKDVTLIRDLAAVGQINSDPDRLRQVVMNLLGNATKFTETGSITLSLNRNGDAVELAVADTGIGIPADDLPHIFDEFRRVERQGGEGAEGTGLGLAIAKKTVDLLGGEISATSVVGQGTTFTVRLPVN